MSDITIEYKTDMTSPEMAEFISLSREEILTSRKIEDKHVAYVAIIDGKICGAMIFTEFDGLSEFWIDVSFVREEHRRKGIHTMLFNALKEHAENVGIKRIQCEVVNTNSISKAAMDSQGRKAFSTIYRYDTKQEESLGKEE